MDERDRFDSVLVADKTPAAPQWMVEKRKPAEREQKQPPAPLAARLRALGYRQNNDNTPDSEIGDVMVSLDEFHETISVIFVEYNETIYDFLQAGQRALCQVFGLVSLV